MRNGKQKHHIWKASERIVISSVPGIGSVCIWGSAAEGCCQTGFLQHQQKQYRDTTMWASLSLPGDCSLRQTDVICHCLDIKWSCGAESFPLSFWMMRQCAHCLLHVNETDECYHRLLCLWPVHIKKYFVPNGQCMFKKNLKCGFVTHLGFSITTQIECKLI